MTIRLFNSGSEPLSITVDNTENILEKGQEITIVSSEREVVNICHINKNHFNTLWYILNEIFTLEQMRTVLVVDGEYEIIPKYDGQIIKIKSYEYVFDKHTSYKTAVFASDGAIVSRKSLFVQNGKEILKKARFLYLFGGSKTIIPLTAIVLLLSIFDFAFSQTRSFGDVAFILVLTALFLLFGWRYIKSLSALSEFMREENIKRYFLSERVQYRKFSDDLVQKNLDIENDIDFYQ